MWKNRATVKAGAWFNDDCNVRSLDRQYCVGLIALYSSEFEDCADLTFSYRL